MNRNVANTIINDYIKKQSSTRNSADVVDFLQEVILDLLETTEPSRCMKVLTKFEVLNRAVPDHRSVTNICV